MAQALFIRCRSLCRGLGYTRIELYKNAKLLNRGTYQFGEVLRPKSPPKNLLVMQYGKWHVPIVVPCGSIALRQIELHHYAVLALYYTNHRNSDGGCGTLE